MQATITKTKDAQPMGTYQPTAVDAMKAAADFLLIDVSYLNVIRWKNGSQETVTNRQLEKLKKTHTWHTDF